jgi:hypothetical protein
LVPYGVGLINIQTGDDETQRAAATTPANELRGRPSQRGHPASQQHRPDRYQRTVLQSGTGANRAYGVDGVFSFFQNLVINSYWRAPTTSGVRADTASYRAQLDYNGRPVRRASSSGSRLATISIRRSASCAATTCAATSDCSASAPRLQSPTNPQAVIQRVTYLCDRR